MRSSTGVPVLGHPGSGIDAQKTGGVPYSYIMLAGAWLFDFQASSAGQGLAIQAVYLAIYLGGLFLFALPRLGGGARISGLSLLVILGALYLAVGTLSGLSNPDTYALARNAVGVFVYLSAVWATAKVTTEAEPAKVRAVLAWLCLPYAVMMFLIYNYMAGGIDFARIRYQVIGTSSVASLGLLVTYAAFRLSPVQLATIALNFAILLVSITRTFLVVLAAQGLVMLSGARDLIGRRLFFALSGLVLMMGGAIAFGSDQLLRWQDRLDGQGQLGDRDQTFATRVSEWEFMFKSWTQSLDNLLFGSGFNAPTQYFEPMELGGRAQMMVGFGHSQHLSMLFNGGLLGGAPLLGLMALFVVWAIRFLRAAPKAHRPDSDIIFLGAWGGTIVIGVFAADFFSASFGMRGQAMWYGIGTGLLLGARARFDPANAGLYRRNPDQAGSGRAS